MWKRIIFLHFRNPLKCIRYTNSTSSVDTSELEHFKQFTKEWWDEMGQLKALHTLNRLRVPFIRDGLINTGALPQHNINSPTPLKGISVLDVGCGGGILTEPLSRIGASVTGLDASSDLIEKARSHTKVENLQNVQYVCSSIEEHATNNMDKYDVVVASEIVEHVTQKEEFLKGCLSCLKSGGSIFLTTINKTYIANFLAIYFAENILKLLPKGTHEYDKFIKPHHLQRILEEENCKTILTHGMFYNVFTNEWTWCRNNDINYALHAVKLQKI